MDYTYYTNGVETGTESVYLYSYCNYYGSNNPEPKTDLIYLGGGSVTIDDTSTLDFASDCNSWMGYTPVGPGGNYQATAVTGIDLDYTTIYLDRDGNYQIEYIYYKFSTPLFFEFPRIRANGVLISAGEAAELSSHLDISDVLKCLK